MQRDRAGTTITRAKTRRGDDTRDANSFAPCGSGYSRKVLDADSRQSARESHPCNVMKRNYMDLAVAGLSILGPIFLAYAFAVWGFTNGYRTSALWTGAAGVGMLVVAIALQIQQNIWKIDASEPRATVAEMSRERAYVSVVDGELVYAPGKPPTVNLILRNTGRTEARGVKWTTNFTLASAAADIHLGWCDEAP